MKTLFPVGTFTPKKLKRASWRSACWNAEKTRVYKLLLVWKCLSFIQLIPLHCSFSKVHRSFSIVQFQNLPIQCCTQPRTDWPLYTFRGRPMPAPHLNYPPPLIFRVFEKLFLCTVWKLWSATTFRVPTFMPEFCSLTIVPHVRAVHAPYAMQGRESPFTPCFKRVSLQNDGKLKVSVAHYLLTLHQYKHTAQCCTNRIDHFQHLFQHCTKWGKSGKNSQSPNMKQKKDTSHCQNWKPNSNFVFVRIGKKIQVFHNNCEHHEPMPCLKPTRLSLCPELIKIC